MKNVLHDPQKRSTGPSNPGTNSKPLEEQRMEAWGDVMVYRSQNSHTQ